MIKFFGEFLVSKKLISKDSLVNSLLLQIRTVPNAGELAHELNLLNSVEILEVFKLQYERQLDFLSAYSNLESFDEKVIGKIQYEISKRRKPLGQILVEEQVLSLSDLAKSLDEYLGQRPQDEKLVVDPVPEAKKPIENLQTLVEIDSDALLELSPLFEEVKITSLRNSIEFLRNRSSSDPILMEEVEKNIFSQLEEIKAVSAVFEIRESVSFIEYCTEQLILSRELDESAINGCLDQVLLNLGLYANYMRKRLDNGADFSELEGALAELKRAIA